VVEVAAVPDTLRRSLEEALEAGRHAGMTWLAETAERRGHPRALWPDVRSVVMLAMNYGPERDPMEDLSATERGVISVYARGRDYHDVMKGRMKTLAQRLVAGFGGDVKVFVDTAPVMEKPLAQLAGIGWQGKHSNLVSRRFGSWLFLGALFTTLDLPADEAHADRCGSCRRCLAVCPTDAFPAPYKLDARRCLAYWTVEAKEMMPRALRPAVGNRIFGCDDCLAVCPWNSFARRTSEAKLAGEEAARPLAELGELDDAAFRKRFSGTPVKRIGRERFVRNVMIAVGNAAVGDFAPLIARRAADEAPQVRAAAAWAARRSLPQSDLDRLRDERLALEDDPMVRAEWTE